MSQSSSEKTGRRNRLHEDASREGLLELREDVRQATLLQVHCQSSVSRTSSLYVVKGSGIFANQGNVESVSE
jgi:hypothetical protein